MSTTESIAQQCAARMSILTFGHRLDTLSAVGERFRATHFCVGIQHTRAVYLDRF